MTREEIIRMAKEAGWLMEVEWDETDGFMDLLERFAIVVAAAEREECAKVCESRGPDGAERFGVTGALVALDCAERIRARGKR